MDLGRQVNSPRRIGFGLVVVGLCLSLAACAGAAKAAAQPQAVSRIVTQVSAAKKDATTTVAVSVSSPPIAYYAFKEAKPLRLVIDLPDIGPGADTAALAVDDGLVTTVSRELAQIKGSAGTRLTIGLSAEARYEIERQESRLLIALAPQPAEAAQPPAAEDLAPAPQAVAPAPQAATPEAPASQAAPAAAAAAEGLSVSGAASAEGSPCRIQAIEFKRLASGKCRVLVLSTAKAGYELARVSRDTLLLTLRQAALPAELSRPLDTSQFQQVAIDDVSPRQMGAATLISVRFRQVVPYHLTQEGGRLALEFDSSPAEPRTKITLARRPAAAPGTKEEAAQEAAARGPLAAAKAPLDERPADRCDDGSVPGAIRVIYPGQQRRFSGQKISLDFQNADVHNVLRLIAEVSGLNVITTDDVKGKVTMRLQKIPWDQALDIVMASCNLAMSRTGDVIRIAPAARFRDEQKQADEAAQAQLDALRKKEQLVPLVNERIRVNYAKAEKMKDRVADVLTTRGKASFDERTNTVIVRDTREAVDAAKELITGLDWPTPQVTIEARIVEATNDFTRELGVQWGMQFQKAYSGVDGTVGVQGRSGVSGGAIPGATSGVPFLVNLPTTLPAASGIGFTFSKLSGALNIDARLLASEQQGKLRIISSPRVTTLDNSEAYIQQGEDIPYLSQSVDGISTQFVQTALKLTVTPHITPDGRVRMKIKAEKSQPSDRIVQGTPGILRKETQTEVLVDHGETVVLGGIYSDSNNYTENRVPFLHRVPGLGWLFRSENHRDEKQEMLIFITPKIVAMEKAHAAM